MFPDVFLLNCLAEHPDVQCLLTYCIYLAIANNVYNRSESYHYNDKMVYNAAMVLYHVLPVWYVKWRHPRVSGFVLFALLFSVECFVDRCLSFFLLAFVLSVLIRYTDSDYPFVSSNFLFSLIITYYFHIVISLFFCIYGNYFHIVISFFFFAYTVYDMFIAVMHNLI